MPTGLSIPVGASPSGGASLVNGDDNDIKIIKLALSDDDNDNAFQQDIGLGIDMIFDLSDPMVRSKIIVRITRLFTVFQAQKRFRLLANTIEWDEDLEEQELILQFKYLYMESDEVKEFEQKFGAGGGK